MKQVLSNLRIIEFGTDVAAANTGRLLAAYGADVITIEPPQGHPIRYLPPWPPQNGSTTPDPETSILFAYLGTGKRSVRLDLENSDDVDRANRLILSAHGVIDSYQPGHLVKSGIDIESLAEEKPSLSAVRITPYGQTGPKADWSASALTSAASGGQLYLTGDKDKPPLLTAGHQAYYQGSLHALGALLTALFAAERTGIGDIVDISLQEVQAATLEGAGPSALWYNSEQPRGGNNPRALWGVHPCKDGWIGVASMPRQTHSVLDVMSMPELKEDPLFRDSKWSPESDDLLRHLVPNFTASHTAEEIFEMADEHRAPFAMIPTPDELLKWPHYLETAFWQEVDHPVLGKHPVPSGPVSFSLDSMVSDSSDRGEFRPAPKIGEHTVEVLKELDAFKTTTPRITPGASVVDSSPLEGIRIVDMTQVWSGPYATRFLADMGADVIKVEGPTFPDPIRTAAGARTIPEINISPYFSEYNRGKRSLVIDIKQESGLNALKKLISTADVFVENWSSGVAERNELGYKDLISLNPQIVYVSMPGFGHTGSDASRVGFGPTIEQMGGLVALQGYEGDAPHKSGISYGDPIAGATCAAAIVSGLLYRQRNGTGCYSVLPQRDGVTGLIGEFVIAESLRCPMGYRIGSSGHRSTPHNVYPCKPDLEPRKVLGPDRNPIGEVFDRWLAIDCRTDGEWRSLIKVIANSRLFQSKYSTLSARESDSEKIDEIISGWTSGLNADKTAALLQSHGVNASAVQTALLLLSDAHLEARNNFISVSHDEKGIHQTARPTWRLANRPRLPALSSPLFGAHNEEILHELGYSPEKISEMSQTGAISTELLGAR